MKHELGPLPDSDWLLYLPAMSYEQEYRTSNQGYDADDMHAYATQEVAAAVAPLEAEIQRLRAALEKIADWDSNWGPFPENNEYWRAMAVVTARQAVPLTAIDAAMERT